MRLPGWKGRDQLGWGSFGMKDGIAGLRELLCGKEEKILRGENLRRKRKSHVKGKGALF